MPNNPELESIQTDEGKGKSIIPERPANRWSKRELPEWEISDVLDWVEDNIDQWQQTGLSPFPWSVIGGQQLTNLSDLKKFFVAQVVSGNILSSVMDDADDEILKEIGIEPSKSKSDIRDYLRQQLINLRICQQEKAEHEQALLKTGVQDAQPSSVFRLSLTQKSTMHHLMFYQNQFDIADMKNTKAYCVATQGLRQQMEDAETVGCVRGLEALTDQQIISVLEKTFQSLNESLAVLPEAQSAGSAASVAILRKDSIVNANKGDTISYKIAGNVVSLLTKKVRSLSNESDRNYLINKILPKNDADPGPWGHSYIRPDDMSNIDVTMRVGAPGAQRLNFPDSMGDHATFGITGRLDKIRLMANPDVYIHHFADKKESGAILIGCDGLTEEVRLSRDVLQASSDYLKEGIDQITTTEPFEYVRHLVTKAFKDGSGDNITALMLRYNAETLAQLTDKNIVMGVFDGHGGPLISTYLSICFIPILKLQVQMQRLESELERLQSKSDEVSAGEDLVLDGQAEIVSLQSQLDALNKQMEEVFVKGKLQALQRIWELRKAEEKADFMQTVADLKLTRLREKIRHASARPTLFSGKEQSSISVPAKAESDKPVEYKAIAKDLAQSALDSGVTHEKKDYEMETMGDDQLREQLRTIEMLIVEANRGISYEEEFILDPHQKPSAIEQHIEEQAKLEAVLSDLRKQRERYKKHLEKRDDAKTAPSSKTVSQLVGPGALTDRKPASSIVDDSRGSMNAGQLSDDFVRKLTFLSRQVSLIATSFDAETFENHQTEMLCNELGVDLTQLAKDGSFKEIDQLTANQLQAIVDEVHEVSEERERNRLSR